MSSDLSSKATTISVQHHGGLDALRFFYEHNSYEYFGAVKSQTESDS